MGGVVPTAGKEGLPLRPETREEAPVTAATAPPPGEQNRSYGRLSADQELAIQTYIQKLEGDAERYHVGPLERAVCSRCSCPGCLMVASAQGARDVLQILAPEEAPSP